MTTGQESNEDAVVPLPECENVETTSFDEALFRPFSKSPRDPLRAGPRGVDIRIRVPSSQTANQYTCVETALAPKTLGPSPHEHDHLDELAFVLKGTLSVMVEDEVCEVPKGGFHWRPRGRVHSFWNATDEPVCFLDMFLNQNFDEYLEAFFALREELNRPGSGFTEQAYAEQLTALDREFGVTQYHERRDEILERYELSE